MPTIERIITGDEEPASVTLLSLARSDTGATPAGVSLPAAFTDGANGAWTFAFTDASPPPYYLYTYRRTWADSTIDDGSGTLASGALTGAYCDIADVAAEMGETNMAVAADPDSDGVVARNEQKALDFHGAVINAALARNGFATPANAQLPVLRIIAAKLSAWQLYRIRGNQDAKPADHFEEKRAWAMRELDELLFQNRGGFTWASGVSNAPISVAATVDADGRTLPVYPAGRYWDGYCWVG